MHGFIGPRIASGPESLTSWGVLKDDSWGLRSSVREKVPGDYKNMS